MTQNSIPKLTKNGKKNGNSKQGKMFAFKFELNFKNIVLGLFIVFLVFSLLGSVGGQNSTLPEKPLSTVIADVKTERSKKLKWRRQTSGAI